MRTLRTMATALLLALLLAPALTAAENTTDMLDASPAGQTTFYAGYGAEDQVLGSGIAYPIGYTPDGDTLYATDRATLAAIVKQSDSRTVYVYPTRDPKERYEVARAISPDQNPLVILVIRHQAAYGKLPKLANDFVADASPCTIAYLDDALTPCTTAATLNGGSDTGAGCIYSLVEGSYKNGNPVLDAAGQLVGVVYQDRSVASAGYLMAILADEGWAFETGDYVSGKTGLPVLPIAAGGGALAMALVLVLVLKNRRRAKKKPAHADVDAPATARPTTLWVRCLTGELAGRMCPVGERCVIGRDPKGCALVYSEQAAGVSAMHCALCPGQDGALELTDLGSTYGTFVDALRLTPNRPKALRAGDQFSLGDGRNTFEVFSKE